MDNKEIKLVEFFLDPNKKSGLNAIEFVFEPAMEGEDGIKFFSKKNNDGNIVTFFKKEDENGEIQFDVMGLVMRPDKRILRKYKDEFFDGIFSKKTVKDCLLSFVKNKKTDNSGLEHRGIDFNKVIFYQNWIVDNVECDKATVNGFKDVREGDWWTVGRVMDENLYNYLKEKYENGKSGFSVEADLDFDMSIFEYRKMNDEDILKYIDNILDENLTEEKKFEKIKYILNI